jgi:hypothetical protein
MKPHVEGRTVALLTAAIVPPAFFLSGRSPAQTLLALASLLTIAAGLAILERMLHETGALASVSVAACLLTLYGTGLLWHAVLEPRLGVALTFVAGTLLVGAWMSRVGASSADAIFRGAALGVGLAGLALLTALAAGDPPSLARPSLLDSLFSSRHGLLFWVPVLTAAIFGLTLRAGRGHRGALGALGALAVLAVVNASLRPWWSGGFANARSLPALPLFALGLAFVLDFVATSARRHPLRLAAAAGVALVLWNLLLMAQYRDELIPRDDTVSFPEVAENGARLLARAAGAPTAWPANWLFAARHDLPAARYDLLGGQDVLAFGPTRIAMGNPDSEAAFLGTGWSVRHPCGTSTCREVDGRAVLYLPLVDLRPAEVLVRAQGSGLLRLTLNGHLLAQTTLAPTFADVAAIARAQDLRHGPNALALEIAPGGQAVVDAIQVMPRGDRP